MCEFAGKLTAWLDGELAGTEAAAVESHLHLCGECHERVEAYRRAVSAFDQYCAAYSDAVLAVRSDRKPPRRVLLVSAAGAVAAAVAVLLLSAPGPQIKISPVRPTAAADSAPIAYQPDSAAQVPQAQDANWNPSGLAVEIAISGDDIAPPGALPEGVGFTGDVVLAPDGSAQQIQIRPQLTEFERRPSRP